MTSTAHNLQLNGCNGPAIRWTDDASNTRNCRPEGLGHRPLQRPRTYLYVIGRAVGPLDYGA
jgi:hypothetical protein